MGQYLAAEYQGAPDRDTLIRLIYQGAVESPLWAGLPRVLRRHLRASHVSLLLQRNRSLGSESVAMVDYQSPAGEVVNRYKEGGFAETDPIPYATMEAGKAYLINEFIGAKEDSVYYQDFLKPAGLDEILTFHVQDVRDYRCWVVVVRREAMGAFTPDEIAECEWLAGHMAVALGIHTNLKRVELERDIHAGALRNLNMGYALLDQHGKVISLDEQAEFLLAGNREIFLRDGQLQVCLDSKNQELQQLVAEGLATGDRAFSRALNIVGAPGLGLLVKSAPNSALLGGDPLSKAMMLMKTSSPENVTPHLVIYINTFASLPGTPLDRLAELFSLNRKEAALVLELVKGRTLSEAAAAIHISEQTARSYSKRIFTKTGTHRQADLVRLILTSVALMA